MKLSTSTALSAAASLPSAPTSSRHSVEPDANGSARPTAVCIAKSLRSQLWSLTSSQPQHSAYTRCATIAWIVCRTLALRRSSPSAAAAARVSPMRTIQLSQQQDTAVADDVASLERRFNNTASNLAELDRPIGTLWHWQSPVDIDVKHQ